MKLAGLLKLPSALAATSTKTVVTAALLAGVTSAATATVVVIGSNAISPTPHAASGQPSDGFIVGAKPGTTPLVVVPKSSSSASSKPTHSPSPTTTPFATTTPSATSTPSAAAPPPNVVVIDNPVPNTPTVTPAEPSQQTSSPSSTPPSPAPSSTPARSHAPSPSKTPKPSPKPTPKPTPTPSQPSCGTFTSAQINWAAQEIGISASSLKSAIKAHPAAICCLPRAGESCHPANQADLIKLAKQVEALEHKSSGGDKDNHPGDSNNQGSNHGSDQGGGNSNSQGDNGKNGHGGNDGGKGHDNSGCWHAR